MQTDPIGYEDGMNRYAYVGNDLINTVELTGEFAHLAIGFVVGAGVELASQYLTGKEVSLTKAAVSGLAGAATGGQIVATTTEKVLAGTMALGGGAVLNTGAGMVNDSLDSFSSWQIVDNAVENAVESLAPHVKAVGKIAGAVVNKELCKTGVGDTPKQLGTEAATQGSEKIISESCSSVKNEC